MLLDPIRFPRVTRLIEDPSIEDALLKFAAAIPWGRDPRDRGVRADDDLYVRSIADWTELILRAHALGSPYFIHSTGVSASSGIDSSPSWFALDELIRYSRPEGLRFRAILQQATIQPGVKGENVRFKKTGWYDDGSVQSWVFVFWNTTPAPV
jgi:hypothetical protein